MVTLTWLTVEISFKIVRANGQRRRMADNAEVARLTSKWIDHIDEAD